MRTSRATRRCGCTRPTVQPRATLPASARQKCPQTLIWRLLRRPAVPVRREAVPAALGAVVAAREGREEREGRGGREGREELEEAAGWEGGEEGGPIPPGAWEARGGKFTQKRSQGAKLEMDMEMGVGMGRRLVLTSRSSCNTSSAMRDIGRDHLNLMKTEAGRRRGRQDRGRQDRGRPDAQKRKTRSAWRRESSGSNRSSRSSRSKNGDSGGRSRSSRANGGNQSINQSIRSRSQWRQQKQKPTFS